LHDFWNNKLHEMLYLCRPNVYEITSDKAIRDFAFFWCKLLKPVRETFNKPDSYKEGLIIVILQTRHKTEPGEFVTCAVRVPLHNFT